MIIIIEENKVMDPKLLDKLEKAEYRLTRQRQAVVKVMYEQKGSHLSAEEVLAAAREKAPNLGIATVYRTLDRLASMGVLYKTEFNEGKYRYELADADLHQHHHILCVGCGKIFELEERLLDTLEQQLEQEGFHIINHQLKILAYCAECEKHRR